MIKMVNIKKLIGLLLLLAILPSMAFAYTEGQRFSQAALDSVQSIDKSDLFINDTTPTIQKVKIDGESVVFSYSILSIEKINKSYIVVKKEMDIPISVSSIRRCFNKLGKNSCLQNKIYPVIGLFAKIQIESEIKTILKKRTKTQEQNNIKESDFLRRNVFQ